MESSHGGNPFDTDDDPTRISAPTQGRLLKPARVELTTQQQWRRGAGLFSGRRRQSQKLISDWRAAREGSSRSHTAQLVLRDQLPCRTRQIFIYEEFDPGSERTLAAGFRHASRTRKPQGKYSGVRVSNGSSTYRADVNNFPKGIVMHDETTGCTQFVIKGRGSFGTRR